jgi:DNA invertase Pin-like site-specific DNA recombinase
MRRRLPAVADGLCGGYAQGEERLVMGRAACYVRVSTEEQREGLSLGAQVEQIRARARVDGCSVDECLTYCDAAFSGVDLERPAYQQMLGDAVARRFDVLYVWAFDRLGRDAEELLRARRVFETVGVRLISVVEGEAASVLVYGIRALIAQEERQRISERTRLALQRRARAGYYHGGKAPFGFVRCASVSSELAVDAEAAETVQRVYRLFAAGVGATTIARQLNREGVEPPLSRQWSANEVRAIIDNVAYCGQIRYGSEIYEGRQPAIVTRRLWTAAAAIRRRRQDVCRETRGRRPSGRHLLIAGLLRCGVCGSAMGPRRLHARGGVEIYRCIRRTRTGDCSMAAAERTAVDQPILSYFYEHLLDREETLRLAIEADAASTGTYKRQVQLLKRRVTSLETAVARAERDYLKAELDASDWRTLRGELESQRAKVIQTLSSLHRNRAAGITSPTRLRERLEAISAAVAGDRDEIPGGLDPIRMALTLAIEQVALHRDQGHAYLTIVHRSPLPVALFLPTTTDRLAPTRRLRRQAEEISVAVGATAT